MPSRNREEETVIKIVRKNTDELMNEIIKRVIQIHNLKVELMNCRGELCEHCKKYKQEHLGACDNCRYREGGEWKKAIGDE